MIKNIDDLYLILDRVRVENILIKKFGTNINHILSSGGWDIFDDLDKIEFIMEIEKEFNIHIDDFLADSITDFSFVSEVKLHDFLSNITSFKRNLNLEKLGI
jgi:acyl carrier protein